MAKLKHPTARYTWRAQITWDVVRLEPDGTEQTEHTLIKNEDEAKDLARQLDTKVLEGLD
jgi:hypothetical protein